MQFMMLYLIYIQDQIKGDMGRREYRDKYGADDVYAGDVEDVEAGIGIPNESVGTKIAKSVCNITYRPFQDMVT